MQSIDASQRWSVSPAVARRSASSSLCFLFRPSPSFLPQRPSNAWSIWPTWTLSRAVLTCLLALKPRHFSERSAAGLKNRSGFFSSLSRAIAWSCLPAIVMSKKCELKPGLRPENGLDAVGRSTASSTRMAVRDQRTGPLPDVGAGHSGHDNFLSCVPASSIYHEPLMLDERHFRALGSYEAQDGTYDGRQEFQGEDRDTHSPSGSQRALGRTRCQPPAARAWRRVLRIRSNHAGSARTGAVGTAAAAPAQVTGFAGGHYGGEETYENGETNVAEASLGLRL